MGEGVLEERGHVLQRETETWNRWAKGLDYDMHLWEQRGLCVFMPASLFLL